MSTNYYLITSNVSQYNYSIKTRKHIGKNGPYFTFRAQLEWITKEECLEHISKVIGRTQMFMQKLDYKIYTIENDYGESVSLEDLKSIIEGKKPSDAVYETHYKNDEYSYLDKDGYLFSFSDFS